MDAAAEADVEAGGDGAPTEEQAAQYKEVGDEIDEFDAEDDGPEPGDVVASADLPGGSPEAAWDEFMAEHAKVDVYKRKALLHTIGVLGIAPRLVRATLEVF